MSTTISQLRNKFIGIFVTHLEYVIS